MFSQKKKTIGTFNRDVQGLNTPLSPPQTIGAFNIEVQTKVPFGYSWKLKNTVAK